ncbi:MAG TPA: hypothetical protein ENH91_15350 [Leeuwenhoekiella sp.]|nr:hypothetical protein [Leeuwenhoekiella sp.]
MEKTTKTEAFFDQESPFKGALNRLRAIINATVLEEDFKWNTPVYTMNGKNVVGLGTFKNHFAIFFFNGDLLQDPNNVLVNAQEGKTKHMRQLRYTAAEHLDEDTVKTFIQKAITSQKASLSTAKNTSNNKNTLLPKELQNAFSLSDHLKKRFMLLSTEKQQEYVQYIGKGDNEKTRNKRLEHCIPFIMRLRGIDKELLE